MAWERKLIRTVRVRNSQKNGVLAKLLTVIAEAGGNIGSLCLSLKHRRTWCVILRSLPRMKRYRKAILEAMHE